MSDQIIIFSIAIAVLFCLIILLFWKISTLKDIITSQDHELAIMENERETLEIAFAEEKRLAVEAAKKRSRTSQRNQIKGQMGERFTPFMDGFPYNPSDCRFLGEPIDYIIFHNLHECSDGLVPLEAVELVIADVKTGDARLSKRQKILKHIIANGQVRFETFRIHESTKGEVEVE